LIVITVLLCEKIYKTDRSDLSSYKLSPLKTAPKEGAVFSGAGGGGRPTLPLPAFRGTLFFFNYEDWLHLLRFLRFWLQPETPLSPRKTAPKEGAVLRGAGGGGRPTLPLPAFRGTHFFFNYEDWLLLLRFLRFWLQPETPLSPLKTAPKEGAVFSV